eukprot:TRINITY_DN8020_c0_g1_i2.p1 TRINITY_DN8020_c0_g1~~TRINITY_DN8020_c0_g1_i2.p1  ORF type:complete len:615 (+),score=155.48 TRINITY_DN8020_c0_g1_i2:59-1846(+)
MDQQLQSARDLFKRMSIFDDRVSQKLENSSDVGIDINQMWGEWSGVRRRRRSAARQATVEKDVNEESAGNTNINKNLDLGDDAYRSSDNPIETGTGSPAPSDPQQAEEATALQNIALADGWKVLSNVKEVSDVTDATHVEVGFLDTRRIYAELSFAETPQKASQNDVRKKGKKDVISPPPTAWDNKTHPVRIEDCPVSPKALNEISDFGGQQPKSARRSSPTPQPPAAVGSEQFLYEDFGQQQPTPKPKTSIPRSPEPACDNAMFKKLGDLMKNPPSCRRSSSSEDVEFNNFQQAIKKKQVARNKGRREDVLFRVKILLFDGESATLDVSPNDDFKKVATSFARNQNLPDVVIPALTMKLQQECNQQVCQPSSSNNNNERVPLAPISGSVSNAITRASSKKGKAAAVGSRSTSIQRSNSAQSHNRSRVQSTRSTRLLQEKKTRTASASSARSQNTRQPPPPPPPPTHRKTAPIPNPGIRLYNQGMRQRSVTAAEAREARRLREERELRLATFRPSISTNAKLLNRRRDAYQLQKTSPRGVLGVEDKEFEECTFTPKISEESERLVGCMRAASLSPPTFEALYQDAEDRNMRKLAS